MSQTLAFDHVHLSAPDQAEASQWYIEHLGAMAGASPERVLVGDALWLIFYKAPDAPPSRGSVIDSIGFSVENAAAKLEELVAAGASLIQPARDTQDLMTIGIVDDPFGARLAIVEDPEMLGFHHVRLRIEDPDAAFRWYLEMFGGERTLLKGATDAVKYGRVWLLAETGDALPSEGHAIDHIAWRTSHLDTTAAELKGKHVTFTMEPRQFNERVRISFVTGPAGTRIEVLERTE